MSSSCWASSSMMIGYGQRWRSEIVSRHVAHGASSTKSRFGGSIRSIRSAVSGSIPPFASTRKNSPGCLSARDAAIRSASSAGPPSLSSAPILME